MNNFDKMEWLISGILDVPQTERPELLWLKEQYEHFLRKEKVSGRRAADRCLYERIYGRAPEKESDILKIRYWRTGHHFPVNLTTCMAFGQALRLDGEKQRFLMQGYYDSCDRIFETEPERTQGLYWERRAVIEKLIDRYLYKISGQCREWMNAPSDVLRHNIRHLYYKDALRYVRREYAEQKYDLEKHISSINYDSELTRNLRLLGVIPRKTMIRHLMILGMQELSVDFMNKTLADLGYLPLREDHTLRTGEKLDLLLIRLLRRYEERKGSRDTGENMQWMQENLQSLDRLLDEHGAHRQRFMLFKALET